MRSRSWLVAPLVLLTGTVAVTSTAFGNENIVCVQQQLQRLGYNPGPVDGILGMQTHRAFQAFGVASGEDIAILNYGNAAASCARLRAALPSKEVPILPRTSSAFLPADLLAQVHRATPEVRARMCKPDFVSETALRQTPIHSIAGLNSRQDNVHAVQGAFQLEQFAGAFGAQAIYAFAVSDEAARHSLLAILAKWARADALLGTRSCVTRSGNLVTSGDCSEWRLSDGSDLSGMKDATFATFIGAGLVRAYLIALADLAPSELAEEHAAIRMWIEQWSQRLKKPTNVYFGLNMGWYWPAITSSLAKNDRRRAQRQLRTLEQGLLKLVNADGSIVDRTTRGDRALWYHYTSIGEVVISMELMRAAGMQPSPKLEHRLHSAVDLFLRALEDERVLEPWARQQHNSRYSGKQDWKWHQWHNSNFAGSWLHIYPYRYPSNPNARKLRQLVPITARSATTDIDLGVGIGCLYNIASTVR